MNEVTKACIAGVIAGAALFSAAKHANAEEYILGTAQCHVWTDANHGEFDRMLELGYTIGFADSYSLNADTRTYKYGEVVAAITRECYRDPKQMIAAAAIKAMKTFEK
jgi:hypothetical protein